MTEPDDPNPPRSPAPEDEATLPHLKPSANQDSSVPTSPGPGWVPPTPAELDAELPAFEVRQLLGHGGMGAVYRAIQKSLNRSVAIKVLPPEIAGDPAFAERFKREAHALAELNHPNIVHIHDFGETEAGMFYFVMEFVDGSDFHDLIRSGSLDPEKTLHAVSQICDALAYAHGKGYVHRDIKPANIFLNEEGQVKVGDFGLAKLFEGEEKESATDPLLTMTGTTVGTPQYIAPEAISGEATIDQRADIYSLGVMFYEMLTGQVPRGAFDPPSKKVSVDVRFDEVVLKAMAEVPERRYQSALEVRSDVDAIREGKGSAGRPSKTKRVLVVAIPVCLAVVGFFLVRENEPARDGASEENPVVADPARATRERPFENNLGMRFVPVPITGGPTDGERVLFSIWETRHGDFMRFVRETSREWVPYFFYGGDLIWKDNHPVVNVKWEDADAFCQWLTAHDKAAGSISPNQRYRLPSDHEWSCAAGIGSEEDAVSSPMSKSAKAGGYWWGNDWPPSDVMGNFYGEDGDPARPEHVISGYRDDFHVIAPVGSFPANGLGLFDLGGNVSEWCSDQAEPDRPELGRVARDASFGTPTNSKRTLRKSARNVPERDMQAGTSNGLGFRVVLETDISESQAVQTDKAKLKITENRYNLPAFHGELRPIPGTAGWRSEEPGELVAVAISPTEDEINFPDGLTDIVSFYTAMDYWFAIRSDESATAWGKSAPVIREFPENLRDVVAISASGFGQNAIALHRDGTVTPWGGESGLERKIRYDRPTEIVSVCASYEGFLLVNSSGQLLEYFTDRYTGSLPELDAVRAVVRRSSGYIILHKDGSLTPIRRSDEIEDHDDLMLSPPKDLPPVRVVGDSAVILEDGRVIDWVREEPRVLTARADKLPGISSRRFTPFVYDLKKGWFVPEGVPMPELRKREFESALDRFQLVHWGGPGQNWIYGIRSNGDGDQNEARSPKSPNR